ncbi:MAG: extracellular solute-binding protein [Treponema sp.]|jgi:multiple sugar transport system substrate-binding protein|nr:extracellular solute-binding protein [Treponema sp.]
MKDFLKKYGDKALFVLALVFLAAALFRREAWQPAETPGIVFTQWWEGDLDKDTLRVLADEFEALHSGIKVTINYRAYEDLRRDIFSSGETPPPGDLIALDPLWAPELLGMEIIEEDITFLSFIDVLYYNVDILKSAGFSRPPKNRSEFLDYARTLAGRKEILPGYVLGLALGENSTRGIYDDIFPWIWATGIRLINDGSPVVNSRQVVESLAFLAALNSEGLIAPDAFRADAARKLEHFITGEVAFMIAPTLYIAQVRERMGDEAFGITSVPGPDNYFGRPFFAAPGWAFAVHSESQRKEEARLFAEFLAGKAAAFPEQTGAVPGNGFSPTRDPFYSKVWDIAITGESARDFAGLPWTEMEAVFREELISLFAGSTSPAQAAAAIQERWGK